MVWIPGKKYYAIIFTCTKWKKWWHWNISIFTPISKRSVCIQSTSQMYGEVPFCTYVHRASIFSIVHYDVFVYGTAYLVLQNRTSQVAFSLGLSYNLRSPLSANEQKLLKIDCEDRWLVAIDPRERLVYYYRGSSVTTLGYSYGQARYTII